MTAQPSSQAEREDVALESLAPEIVAYFSADPCLIWSDEWRQFWRPNGNGYTSDQGEAWHLTLAEAYARTRHCDPSKGIRFVRPDREHATPRSMPEEVVEAGRPIDTAPRDGTMVRLLVDYTDGGGPLDDAQLAWTIGFNGFEDHGVDEWKFAGWCWTHDHFTQGSGTPVGWLPWSNPSTGGDEA